MLQPFAALGAKFAETRDAAIARRNHAEARRCLDEMGAARTIVAAVSLQCRQSDRRRLFRVSAFYNQREIIDEVAREAEPWIDLWRDRMHTSRVASRLACEVSFQSAPVKDGAVALPAFLRHCETQKMPLTSHGLVALAHIAFLELKAAFQEFSLDVLMLRNGL